MAKQLKCTGVLLAGGESRRFGRPKVLARWNNETFFEHSMNSIAPYSDNLLAVVKKECIEELKKCNRHNAEFISDIERFRGNGPLAGIYSAMIRKKADYYLITPCDMPRMSSRMYEKWLHIALKHPESDCIVPVLNGKIYPLNGVYKKTCLPDITASLNKGTYKVLSLLDRKNTLYIEVNTDEEHYFTNINTENELLDMGKDKI